MILRCLHNHLIIKIKRGISLLYFITIIIMGKMKELYILAQDSSADVIIQLITDAEKANKSFVVIDGREIPIEKAKAIASIVESTIKNQYKSIPGDA
jgi:hypothetical protein